jgi:MFS family permease
MTNNDEAYAYVELTRATPAAVYPFGAAGVLLGVVIGWLTFGWASRRTKGHALPQRAVIAVLFGVAIFLWCAPIVVAFPSTLTQQIHEPLPSWHPMWEWLGQPALAPLFVVGTGAALLALAASALPNRREPATDVQSAA